MTTSTTEQSADATGNLYMPLISNEKLIRMYTTLAKCRRIEELARVAQDKLTGWHDAGMGLDATAVGVTIDLLPGDTLASAQGDWIAGFIMGEPLDKIIDRLSASIAAPDADPMNRVMRAAMENKAKMNGKIAVALLGDGAATSKHWQEAIRVAGQQRLPILFVCQSSLSAEPGGSNAQARVGEIVIQAEACGFPGITVDGSDVVAIYRVATESIIHARRGNGTTLIECQSGVAPGSDSLLNMEAYLTHKGLFREELKLEVEEFCRKLDAALAAAAGQLNS
jgi:TPP-dependent pyruvate/acetoin dehydrogenase alpha subunit